jgi:hypothetical protein
MLRSILFIVILFTTFISPHTMAGKVYSWVDEKGVVVFSDSPRKGAKEVIIKSQAIRMPATDTRILSQSDAPPSQKYHVAITLPQHQDTIRDNNGSVTVTSKVSPDFERGYLLQLKLDGQLWGKPQSRGLFMLKGIDRGEHQIVIELLNRANNVVASSKAVTFYLFRTSMIRP